MLETEVVRDILPSEQTEQEVAKEFRELLAGGVRIKAAGSAKQDPLRLLSLGYAPKHKIHIFDTTFYLTHLRQDDNMRFFVAFIHLQDRANPALCRKEVYPRIFYKDSSLVWRSPTHYILSEDEHWLGKGDLKSVTKNGESIVYAAEETTNLPLEIQHALDLVSRKAKMRRDTRAMQLILRNAPDDRLEPYQDFTGPRQKAAANPRNRINRGRDVASFRKENDPGSLYFVPGFEPDFRGGVIDMTPSASKLYGGEVRKYRILSKNQKIQYQFVAGPRHVWIIPPQTLTREIMSYGVRTIDVHAHEDLLVPGYEYHFIDQDEDPPELHSQIPEGFAGKASEVDPLRADASPWLEKLSVIREFRRQIRLPW